MVVSVWSGRIKTSLIASLCKNIPANPEIETFSEVDRKKKKNHTKPLSLNSESDSELKERGFEKF